MSNALERILSRLEQNDETGVTKTASTADTPAPSAEERMLATVRSLTESATKTASDATATPASNLEKLAADAHAAEEQIMTKKAHTMGAALADGFMARFAQYDTALSDVSVKTAQTNNTEGLAKEAYAAARADLEKRAQADYERGYNDQLGEVQKVAAHYHLAGQQSARNVLQATSQK